MNSQTDTVGTPSAVQERRLRVLLSAYACEPDRGSEPSVGWCSALEAARHHETWVVTRANNRESIEGALRDIDPSLRPHFVYVDLPAWAGFWKRHAKGAKPYYVLWQIAALGGMRRLVDRQLIDVAHHVTFAICWLPPATAFLGIPHVWGPAGGADRPPSDLRSALGPKGRLADLLRGGLLAASLKNPLLRRAAHTAHLAMGTTPASARYLSSAGASRVAVLPAIGLGQAEIASLGYASLPHGGPTRLACVGRLVTSKGFALALLALSKCREDAELWIIGDGPDRQRLEALAGSLGLENRVRFMGWRSRDDTLHLMSECHALIHPSLLDSGGMVCLEALAAGKPVVCLRHGGPAEVVGDDCGVLVPASEERAVIAAIADAMTRFASDPRLVENLSRHARQRVLGLFTWRAKGEFYARIRQDAHEVKRRRDAGRTGR